MAISTALPQTALENGCGHSWSQALLVKRPSKTEGSARKIADIPPCEGAGVHPGNLAFGFAIGFGAVPAITPSMSASRQRRSKSCSPHRPRHAARIRS
jgi:hypothetical protein